MKEEELKEMSLEKLEKTVGIHKGVMYALSFMLLLLFGLSMYLLIGQGKTTMISLAVMPIALLPILLMNGKKINQLNQEINNRK